MSAFFSAAAVMHYFVEQTTTKTHTLVMKYLAPEVTAYKPSALSAFPQHAA